MNLSSYLLLIVLLIIIVNILSIVLTLKKLNKSKASNSVYGQSNQQNREIVFRIDRIRTEIKEINAQISEISDALIIPKAVKNAKNK